MTPQEFAKERAKLTHSVKAKLAPYLYASGYQRNALSADSRPLLLWVPRDRKGKFKNKVYSLKGGFVLSSFEGLTEDGPITDSYGGGLVTQDWNRLPIEDLFRLSAWLDRMLPKLPKAKASSTSCSVTRVASGSAQQGAQA